MDMGQAEERRETARAQPEGASRSAGRRQAKPGGFSLIEILVVIGIIMFLMGFIAVAAVRYSAKVKEEGTRALLQKIGIALSRYYGETRLYPDKVYPTELAAQTTLYDYISGYGDFRSVEIRRRSNRILLIDPWGSDIVYWYSDQAMAQIGNYSLYSAGPDKTAGNQDDINLKRVSY